MTNDKSAGSLRGSELRDRVAAALAAIGGGIGDPGGSPASAYLRVSTTEQAGEDRHGIDRQVQRIHERARANGDWIAPCDIYADDVSGTRTEDRPGLMDLLADAPALASRGLRRVYVEEADRLGRDGIRQQGWILFELQRHGLEVVFADHVQDDLLAAVYAWKAREDNERRRVMIRQANLSKARAGKVTARTPRFGYRLNRETSQYEVREDQAAVVLQIWEWYADGLTLQEIVRRLHGPVDGPPKHRSPTGNDWWSVPSVRSILCEEAYATGRLRVNRWRSEYRRKVSMRPENEWIAVQVPTIVQAHVAARVARRLADSRSPRWNPRRAASGEWLLQGRLKCAQCGHAYSPKSKRNRKGAESRTFYYVCAKNYSRPGRGRSDRCSAGQISKRVVEQRVWEAVLDIVRDPAVIEKAADLRVSAQDIAAEHRQAVDRLAKVESAWRKLWNAYEDEVIDEATFNREAQAIRNRRNTATRDRDAAAQLLADAGNAEQRRRAVVSKLEEIAKRNLSGLPFKERKRLVGQLFDSILVDTNSRTVEFRGPVTGMISLDSPVPSSVPRLSARFSGP